MKQHFQELLARNKWLKWVPNALTIGNSLCGFAAILNLLMVYEKIMNKGTAEGIERVFAVSAILILCAMIFDALDGFAARLLNAASLKGIQMDSLSDMVTFGVAPATLVAVVAHSVCKLQFWQFLAVCILCAIYIAGAALRLAEYNVHAMLEKKSSDKFSGLPSPGAAAAICSVILFQAGTACAPMTKIIHFLPYYAAVLGFLMVSKISYQHFAKWLCSVPRNRKRLVITVILTAVLIWQPFWTTLILVNGYIFWAPLATLAVKLGIIKSVRDADI